MNAHLGIRGKRIDTEKRPRHRGIILAAMFRISCAMPTLNEQ
jgi:hypothetical protein